MEKVNTVKSKMTRRYQYERKHKDYYYLCEIQCSYKLQTIRICLFLFCQYFLLFSSQILWIPNKCQLIYGSNTRVCRFYHCFFLPCHFYIHKQPPKVFYEKSCSKTFCLKAYNLLKVDSNTVIFLRIIRNF